MVAPDVETPSNDDATQLVLDIVRKVFDPPAIDTSFINSRAPLRQNFQNNTNFSPMNIAPININYKRWSNNDCGGKPQQPVNQQNYYSSLNGGAFVNEEIAHRNVNYNRQHQTNFWDQYCSSNSSDEYYPVNNNRMNYASNAHFNNHQYLNNKCISKNTSWRDNSTFNSNKFGNQQLPYQASQPLQKMENMYFQYRKNNRKYCSFCRKNGESYEFYTSHSLYEDGKPSCPVLKQCICNICGQRGHTMSHCNLNASKNSILKMITRFNSTK